MAQKSRFFSLPIELRLLVYKEVLMANDLQILRACRDIYNEALPVLFKRPLKFRTHDDLYNWIRMVGPDSLELVTSVSLNLLSFRYIPVTRPCRPPLHSADMFYRNDLPNLQNALMLLPNVRRFIIYKTIPFLGTRFTYDYYLPFFPWLADRYPELRCLTLFINWIPLDFLLQMRFLCSLRFTGFSTSPPTAALIIFQSLKCLEELEVFGPPPDIHAMNTFPTSFNDPGIKYEQAVTPELLLGIRPLKAFTICEIRAPCRTASMFFCEEIISALTQAHGSSLRSLKISLDFLPSVGSRVALAKLFSLTSSSIRHLELGWPGLDVLTLDTLPPSLCSLQVSCDIYFPPDDAAQKLVVQKPVLPKLAAVVLRTDWRTRPARWPGRDIPAIGGPCGKNSMDAAVARLRSVGLDATTQAHGTISEQLLLCTNLPAVADGVAILTQLTILSDVVTALVGQVTTLNDRMTTVENRLTAVENAVTPLSGRVAAVEVCVAELGPRLQADQINSLARGHNGKLPGADHALEPLVDIKTCVPIPHFPFNAAEVSGMTSANLSTVLTALGAPPIYRETADNKKGAC